MYANLICEVQGPGFEDQQPVYAWDIDITDDAVVLHLDAQDGGGSYAEPDGEVIVPRNQGIVVNVQACF